MDMIRGQKVKIADIIANHTPFSVLLQFNAPFALDVSCFGVDSVGKLSDERYMTFYNQPKTPCQAVQLLDNQLQQSRFLIPN